MSRRSQPVKIITAFIDVREVGDPVEMGAAYADECADELVFLDITASHEGRKTFVQLVKRIAPPANIPFTVGGGISEIGDIEALLAAGADKVSLDATGYQESRTNKPDGLKLRQPVRSGRP